MASKERLMAMAAARCAVCSGAMVLTLVEADRTPPTGTALFDAGFSRSVRP
jgi:hypothetical protein